MNESVKSHRIGKTTKPSQRSTRASAYIDSNNTKKEISERPSPRIKSMPVTVPSNLLERDSYTSTALAELLNRSANATIARFTMGLSPAALAEANFDWLIHLISAPGKRLQLTEKAWRKSARFAAYLGRCMMNPSDMGLGIEPLTQDRRFNSEAWQNWPFNLLYQGFLFQQQWWHNATTDVPGVTHQHERELEFAARQILDVFAPSNFLATNPEVLNKTQAEGGQNLLRGYQNFIEDWECALSGNKPIGAEHFIPGNTVAITSGKVVYSNRLMELIQYIPATDKVHPEPLLIVPAWIMKYYILDLSPENSLVKYMLEQGFTVFMISWKNPGPEGRDLAMESYRTLGIVSALEAISAIIPDKQVHGVGYCLGGTLLSISAAVLERDGGKRFKTLTFLASQVDFEEPGELALFINESQLRFLEDSMWEQGFLDTK